ncbi:MAG: hypothetical protein L0211_10635 [Planctomycetaceae bacterium]|nr:hypothetical protein [Planctomycetaceae bacterium]
MPRRIIFARVVGALAVISMVGCGSGLETVTGRVTFADGTPLDEGTVICEMKEGDKIVMAQGNLERDGTFRLGTHTEGDGAAIGKYRVLVAARQLSDAERGTRPPIIDSKFGQFETSGLELEVKDGANELNITVTKPGQ